MTVTKGGQMARTRLFGLPVLSALTANVVLLSVRDEFAGRIFAGKKRWEFRRVLPGRFPRPDIYVVYSSGKVRRVVGAFRSMGVLEDVPLGSLWGQTAEQSGISEFEFRRYFMGTGCGSAIRIGELEPAIKRVTLKEADLGKAPQSFRYLSIPEWVHLASEMFGPLAHQSEDGSFTASIDSDLSVKGTLS